MERERVGLEEAKTKLEKELFRAREQLEETKSFYEERLTQMDHSIRLLQKEISLLKEQQ